MTVWQKVVGIWLVIDGVASIMVYWRQNLFEHSIRITRALFGLMLVVWG